jgi:hypothetical protein
MTNEKEKNQKAVMRIRKASQKAGSRGLTQREISRTVDVALFEPKSSRE